jgi:hypothetical protein
MKAKYIPLVVILLVFWWGSVSCTEQTAGQDQRSKRRMVLHLGPAKTGTSSIQDFLLGAQSSVLADNGWDLLSIVDALAYPDKPSGADIVFKPKTPQEVLKDWRTLMKWLAQLYHSPCGEGVSPEVKNYVRQLAKGERNIFASNENFFRVKSHCHAQELAELFQDFDVTIVVAYREVLSQMISFYEMITGDTKLYGERFDYSFEQYYEEGKTKSIYNILGAVSLWGKYFDDVRIIDYYGTLARTTTHSDSLQKQLFCEVMGIEPLCSYDFNAVPRKRDSASDEREETQKVSEMIHIFRDYAGKQSCEIPLKAHPFKPTEYDFDIPTKPYEMSPECIAWSIGIDENLRANYSNIIMNGNATLSREKAKAASFVVVDAEAVYQHEGWMEAFSKTIQRSKEEGLCSNHQKHMHGKSGEKK